MSMPWRVNKKSVGNVKVVQASEVQLELKYILG